MKFRQLEFVQRGKDVCFSLVAEVVQWRPTCTFCIRRAKVVELSWAFFE